MELDPHPVRLGRSARRGDAFVRRIDGHGLRSCMGERDRVDAWRDAELDRTLAGHVPAEAQLAVVRDVRTVGEVLCHATSVPAPGPVPADLLGSLGRVSFGTGALRGANGSRGATVDHRLARRMLINEYRRGRISQDQVCDAHPELVRAATNVGEPSQVPCPICDERELALVTYVFGPRLPAQGRCVSDRRTMAVLRRSPDELAAYIVECCRSCRWHHLLRVMPIGGRGRSARRERTAEG
jgi:hypothetical protein